MNRQFISFPKSGRTWVRYMLNRLGCDDAIKFHHDRFEFNDGAKPRHDYGLTLRRLAYRPGHRIVYMDRDPRDVMVSLYHQVTGRFADYFNYQGSLSDFIRDPYFGALVLKGFRDMWAKILADRPGYLHVTYEAVHADAAGVLKAIVDYYGYSPGEAAIREAVESGGIERMREVEQSNTAAQPWMRPRNDAPKVRSGKVGGFAEVLSPEDIAYLDQVFGTSRQT